MWFCVKMEMSDNDDTATAEGDAKLAEDFSPAGKYSFQLMVDPITTPSAPFDVCAFQYSSRMSTALQRHRSVYSMCVWFAGSQNRGLASRRVCDTCPEHEWKETHRRNFGAIVADKASM